MFSHWAGPSQIDCSVLKETCKEVACLHFYFVQIKPDPVAKNEYFSQAFCEQETPTPKPTNSEETDEDQSSDDDSDSEIDSDGEDSS